MRNIIWGLRERRILEEEDVYDLLETWQRVNLNSSAELIHLLADLNILEPERIKNGGNMSAAKDGLAECTLHDLCKTCNTIMRENGVSLEAAMQVLGHSTIRVNQQYYTGTLTKQQKAAVNSLPSIG